MGGVTGGRGSTWRGDLAGDLEGYKASQVWSAASGRSVESAAQCVLQLLQRLADPALAPIHAGNAIRLLSVPTAMQLGRC
jgi:hypothetical protein